MNKVVSILGVALLLGALSLDAQAQVSVRRTPKKEKTETPKSNQPKASEQRRAEAEANARRAEAQARAEQQRLAVQEEVVERTASVPDEGRSTVARRAVARPGTASQPAVLPDGVTLRRQAFDEYQRDDAGEVPWQHVIYRELDVQKGPNASLYFPVEPMDGLTNLFRVIFEALTRGELRGYEYLDGREVFTEKYLVPTRDLLDKFQVYYQEQAPQRGRTEPTFVVEESDVPAGEVLSYFIKERWEFDQKRSRYRPRVLALCPVVHRMGDYGGEPAKYPMCWFNYEDLRPFLRQHLVVSEGMNDAPRFTMEEFFALEQYRGDIYKVQNLRGLSLMQQFDSPESLAHARDSIEAQLRGFGDSIWVPLPEAPAAQPSRRDRRQAASVASVEGLPSGLLPEEEQGVRTNRRTKEVVDVEAAEAEKEAEKAAGRTVRRSTRRTR